ncbi:MAG TPA: hypothetical protein VFT66_12700 [Roseiflexaceae bacterium]|jgi:hypothetical protein|nr:hypothetical protein [Roseiflexaceae bacterium]
MHLIMRVFMLLMLSSLVSPLSASHPLPVPPRAEPNQPPLLGGVPAPVLQGSLAMRTYSIDFYRLPDGMDAASIQKLAMPVEQALISDTARFGAWPAGRVSVRFEPAQTGPCAVRGLTFSQDRTIRLFYAPGSDQRRIIAIMAHELVHQLEQDYYGSAAHLKSDNILLEGMAVWGSSHHFLAADGTPQYQRNVQQALREGALLPLATDLEADCRTTTRNYIYDEWGSFVEFLLQRDGRERFDALYRSGTGRAAGSADYQGVYGKTLDELQTEWMTWLGEQQ